MQAQHDQTAQHRHQADKKRYEAPKLLIYGTLSQLVQGSGNSTDDFALGTAGTLETTASQ